MRLVWRTRAQNDRKRVAQHITESGNLAAALKQDAVFEDKAHTAASGTIRHKPGRIRGTHEIVATPNYVIVYRATKTQISILRVLHARQQWPPAKQG
ncbi:MAG: type II toxin-antitoxin system RelE/ParE family toxin [Alcaligenaceae bacterium]|nr:type II toxin-antitoxin system RelE/ParE family toxin [Alcaligenaceae bacterium]